MNSTTRQQLHREEVTSIELAPERIAAVVDRLYEATESDCAYLRVLAASKLHEFADRCEGIVFSSPTKASAELMFPTDQGWWRDEATQ